MNGIQWEKLRQSWTELLKAHTPSIVAYLYQVSHLFYVLLILFCRFNKYLTGNFRRPVKHNLFMCFVLLITPAEGEGRVRGKSKG